MRAIGRFVLLAALTLTGAYLVGSRYSLLPAVGVEPSFADPQSPASKPIPSPLDNATVPGFVQSPKTLTFADSNSAAQSSPAPSPSKTVTIDTSESASPATSSAPASSEPPSTENQSGDGASSEPAAKSDTADNPPADPDPAKQVVTIEKPDTKSPAEPKIIGAKNLFGAAKTPSPLAARAIGSYARGCLSGAVPLPIDGPAWQEMRLSRNRNWGHPKLIALVEQFAKDAQKLDGWPGLLVGDIAQPRGGPMITGHASHQVGLDADIWLTPMPDHKLSNKEREELQATSMLDKTEVAVDPKIFTDKQVALIKRAASYPEVERIFVHPAIKKALCTAAKTDNAWLGKVRPYWGHYYHFHVRIKCPEGFGGCVPQVPPTGDNGCGKEVDQWLKKVVPAKAPATPPPPAPPSAKPPAVKIPIMLSELPKECQTLLTTGPDPVPIPKEALMTPVALKQVLAKAAAVKAALAKASLASTGSATASGAAAASPALRPHMRKTVNADKK